MNRPSSLSQLLDINLWTPFRMWRVARRVADTLQAHYKPLGLKPNTWRALAHIVSGSPICAKELSAEIGLDAVQTSRTVDRLLKKKLIATRIASDDRRRVELRPTKKGVDLYSKLSPLAQDLESRLFDKIARRDLDTFFVVLAKLEDRAVAIENDLAR